MNPTPTYQDEERKPPPILQWAIFISILCLCPMFVAGPGVFLLKRFSDATSESNITATCTMRLRKIGQAMELYTIDYNGQYPPADRWIDATWRYAGKRPPEDETASIFRCPIVWQEERKGFGYAMNEELSSAKRAEVENPDGSVLVFDSSVKDKNAASSLDSLPNPKRHDKKSENFGVAVNGGIIKL